MSKQVKTFEELKDSKLLYDKKVPDFIFIIITVVSVLFVIIVVWGIRTPKTYIIKSSGTIQSINKNYVMAPYTGSIVKTNVEEGMNVEVGDALLTIKSTDLDLQTKQLIGKKEIYLNQISQLGKLTSSIKDNTNYFIETNEEDSLYYYQFEKYQSQIAQLTIDTRVYKSYGYTDEQIEDELKKNQNKVTEAYYTMLKGIEDTIQQCKNEIMSLEVQIDAIGNGQEEYLVKANASGKVHMMADYKEGMVVQAASALASIASENEEYKVQAYVDVGSIARIKNGDLVKIAVGGLSQSVYGTISGKIIRIDTDMTTDSEGDKSYFKVDIKPDTNYIISKKGEKVNLSNGMAVETRIQYDQVTYFNYLLDSLGILSR